MLYETQYTLADHYLRLLCVNFGRAALGSRTKKRDDVFPLIYYLHWATEGWWYTCLTGASVPGITAPNLLLSLISV